LQICQPFPVSQAAKKSLAVVMIDMAFPFAVPQTLLALLVEGGYALAG